MYSTTDFAGPFTVADLDGDGLTEIYVGHHVGNNATLQRIDYDGIYHAPVQVLDFGDGGSFQFSVTNTPPLSTSACQPAPAPNPWQMKLRVAPGRAPAAGSE